MRDRTMPEKVNSGELATPSDPAGPGADGTRRAYAPPRILKRRSVRRATLFTGEGGPGPSGTPLVSTG